MMRVRNMRRYMPHAQPIRGGAPLFATPPRHQHRPRRRAAVPDRPVVARPDTRLAALFYVKQRQRRT